MPPAFSPSRPEELTMRLLPLSLLGVLAESSRLGAVGTSAARGLSGTA